MGLVIQLGVRDPYVGKIQRALNELQKTNLKADGQFGPGTELVYKDFQRSCGEACTGVYGGKAAEKLDTLIAAKYLTEGDFAKAAEKLGVDVACVKAVQTVESKGAGYLNDGRLVILFERHVFKREMDKLLVADAEATKAIAKKLSLTILPGQQFVAQVQIHLSRNFPDIYNSTPGGYIGGVAEHDRLSKARGIHESCALKSASWGLFQIMGFHHKLLGFASPQDMVNTYSRSERDQLLSFCDFILADTRLLAALRKRDWVAFAKAYNGPAYSTNRYDVRLAEGYKDAAAGVGLSKYVNPIRA